MIPADEEIPEEIEVKVEPDRPKDPDEAMIRIAEGMEAMLRAEGAGGYHVEVTKWAKPPAGRVKISTHAKDLGDVLQELLWIRDMLEHFEGGEE